MCVKSIQRTLWKCLACQQQWVCAGTHARLLARSVVCFVQVSVLQWCVQCLWSVLYHIYLSLPAQCSVVCQHSLAKKMGWFIWVCKMFGAAS